MAGTTIGVAGDGRRYRGAIPETLGPTLARLRRSRGISQNRLAEAVGIDHTTLSRIEGGSRASSVPFFAAAADALGLDAAERAELVEAMGFDLKPKGGKA